MNNQSIDLRQMASQLRRPSGDIAPAVAERMNSSNGAVNRKCIDLLELQAGQRVLEIGPGNAAFACEIVGANRDIYYHGLDWSAEMVREAQRLNVEGVRRGTMCFQQGDAAALPFPDSSFDRVLTVHTLYFWEQPREPLREIRRVLKPGGSLCLAFGERDFMETLPFTSYGFTLYHARDVSPLLKDAGFQQVTMHYHWETGPSNAGEQVDKTINIALASS